MVDRLNLETVIGRDRERLNGEREKFLAERAAIDQKIAEVDRELAAIQAYENTKAGKPTVAAKATRQLREQVMRRSGSKREVLLSLIKENAGLKRSEILDRLGLRGNKAGEMSVSNALTALIKSGTLVRDGGKYHPGNA